MNRLAAVAEQIGAKVECLGGNVYGAVLRHDDPVNAIAYEVLVTVEGTIWTVSRCVDPDGHDDQHDHTLHDSSIAPLMHASDVPGAVTLLMLTAVTS